MSLVNFAPDASVNSRFDYTHDLHDRIVALATVDGNWTFEYDDESQLVGAEFSSSDPEISDQVLKYAYDAAGNRVRSVVNGVATEYQSNELNQYTHVGAAVLGYDLDGNATAWIDVQDAICRFNVHNRLERIETPDGSWSYEYNALGQCTAVTRDGQRTEFLIDPVGRGTVVAEFDDDGAPVARYLHGQNLAARIGPLGETAFFDSDAIGSVCGLSGPAGTYLNRYVSGEQVVGEFVVGDLLGLPVKDQLTPKALGDHAETEHLRERT